MKITLPWPRPGLWPNKSIRLHWSDIHNLRQAAHLLAKAETLNVLDRTSFADTSPLLIRYRFHAPTNRSYDRDNAVAACKPYQDGIAEALGINDNQFKVVVSENAGVWKVEGGGVEIDIYSVEAVKMEYPE